jgi:hypothetical protein
MSSRFAVSVLFVAVVSSMVGCSGSPDAPDDEEDVGASADELTSYNRQTVAGWARSRGAHAPNDFVSASLTKQKLVDAVGWLYGNNAPHFFISAINSDHPTQDGPHGHNGGYCVDLYAVNTGDMLALIKKINADPHVTQVGLGGAYKNYAGSVTKKKFMDNNQTHVHLSVY